MARLAERSGWGGIFVREYLVGMDSWIPIAAAALSTRKILIGGVISPFVKQDSKQILREAYKIHRRSNRRLIVCLGDWYTESPRPDEDLEPHHFEGNQSPFDYQGKEGAAWFAARLSIWRIGLWPDKQSMTVAVRNQGVIPVARQGISSWRSPTIAEVQAISDFVRQERGTTQDFEIVVELDLNRNQSWDLIPDFKAWEEAGATWWIVNGGKSMDVAECIRRLEKTITQGPPA